MTPSSSSRRSRFVLRAGLAAAALGALFLCRGLLVAWFTGRPVGGGTSTAVSAVSAVSSRAGGFIPPDARAGERPAPAPPATTTARPAPGGEVAYYTCSMHPSVHQHAPGKCPICGMNLIPVRRDEAQSGIVTLDDGRQQEIGLRIGAVTRRPLADRVMTVGRVAFDESRLHDVSVKFAGWIGKLYADQTGVRVQRGQILLTLYSPELYGAEQEYLAALAGQRAAQATAAPDRADYLVEAARQKLRLWDLGDGEIHRIAARGTPEKEVPVASPAAGVVVEKNVVQGASVQPGMKLFRIAGLDRVWIEADVFETHLGRVAPGAPAWITLPALPGRRFAGRVRLVEPALAAATRTARVRIEVSNPMGAAGPELLPDMDADVELASPARQALLVPESAVLYTGQRTIVFVDLGGGRFRPREVRLGARSPDGYEVLSGLREGDRVVTSGNFLLDAESRLIGTGESGS